MEAAYLAGHRDMNITKRYVHPQEQTVLDAMKKACEANGGHNVGDVEIEVREEPTTIN